MVKPHWTDIFDGERLSFALGHLNKKHVISIGIRHEDFGDGVFLKTVNIMCHTCSAPLLIKTESLTCAAEQHLLQRRVRQDITMSRHINVTTVYCLDCRMWICSFNDTIPQYTENRLFENGHG
jgi:hypothetical protein